jgi:hypothetical protein
MKWVLRTLVYEGDSYLNKLSINKIIEVGSSDGALLDEPLSHKDHDIWQMVLDAFLVYIATPIDGVDKPDEHQHDSLPTTPSLT